MNTATPMCCGQEAKFIWLSHQTSFYVCTTCKLEVYATPNPCEPRKVTEQPKTQEDDIPSWWPTDSFVLYTR